MVENRDLWLERVVRRARWRRMNIRCDQIVCIAAMPTVVRFMAYMHMHFLLDGGWERRIDEDDESEEKRYSKRVNKCHSM